MSPKFNKAVPASQAVRSARPDTITHQGGEGFTRVDLRDELFLLGVTNFVGEDTFYETGKNRDTRYADLIGLVTQIDPEWVRSFLGWLRTGGLMRSASIVGAAEYVAAGGPGGRTVVSSVLQRPDEPGELLAYWTQVHGRAIPQPIKRGIADALPRLYTERNTLRYDGSGNAYRFGDVIELTHPKPQGDSQSDLYRHLIDRRHNRAEDMSGSLAILRKDRELIALPEGQRRAHLHAAVECGWDWQRLAGWLPGGMDASAWEAIIPNMGLMALTRNLRNFDEKGVSGPVISQIEARFRNPEEVRKSRQFPLRFLSAWKNVSSMRWGPALETAVNLSLSNVPALDGRTLVLVDVSGSMCSPLTQRHQGRSDGVRPDRWESAALFGAAVAQRSKGADLVLFNTQPIASMTLNPTESVLRLVEGVRPYIGGGTNTLGSLAATYNGHDRVVILTDEQTGAGYGGWDAVKNIRVPVYSFNLAGHRAGHTPNQGNFYTFGGLSDACFSLVGAFEAKRLRGWPWS